MPISSASLAETFSPNIMSALARAKPTKRGSVQVPPLSGIKPILVNACIKLADSVATTISQAKAIFAPAPAATPFTAAMTGFCKALIFKEIRLKPLSNISSNEGDFSTSAISAMSCPAQKALPSPVIMTQRTEGSSAQSSKAPTIARRISELNELKTLGRFIVIIPMPCVFSKIILVIRRFYLIEIEKPKLKRLRKYPSVFLTF